METVSPTLVWAEPSLPRLHAFLEANPLAFKNEPYEPLGLWMQPAGLLSPTKLPLDGAATSFATEAGTFNQ